MQGEFHKPCSYIGKHAMQGRNWARSLPRKMHHILKWQGCDAGPQLGSLVSKKDAPHLKLARMRCRAAIGLARFQKAKHQTRKTNFVWCLNLLLTRFLYTYVCSCAASHFFFKDNSRNFTSVCRGHHHGHRSSLSASASPSSAFSGPYSITTLHIVSIVRRHQRHRRRQDSHHPHHRHHHHTYVTYRRPHHRHPHHHTSSTSSHHHIITSSTSSHHHTSSTSSHIITHHRHAHIIDIIIDIHIYLFNHSTMIVYIWVTPPHRHTRTHKHDPIGDSKAIKLSITRGGSSSEPSIVFFCFCFFIVFFIV